MKALLKYAWMLVFALTGVASVTSAIAAAPAKPSSCTACHADLAAVLPKAHVPAKGNNLGACLACHKPAPAAKPAPNAFAVAMHRGHVRATGGVECTGCHATSAKGRYGVAQGKVVLPVDAVALAALKRAMQAPDAARFTAGLHAKANVSCGGCHGAGAAHAEREIDNARCLACHGPLATLAAKTRPAQFADRNPHESHLGEIACTACHKGHEASAVYCLDCHKKFEMTIVGGTSTR
jgi:hypothetical protein